VVRRKLALALETFHLLHTVGRLVEFNADRDSGQQTVS
jgi:hypothetical protein